MCCPLTQATFTWFFTMFISVLLGIGSPLLASGGTSVHSSPTSATHNNPLYNPGFPPFVIAPVPNQNTTTDSEPLVFPLYEVFASSDNSRLSFRFTITNDDVVSGEIENDTLYVFPKAQGTTRIRVTAEDDDDDEATDAFRVNVRENNPPSVMQDFPVRDQAIIQGSTFALDLESIFEDPDGDPLSYEATSSNDEVSSPRIEQDILVAPANAPGITTIEITAEDPFGRTINVQFELEVLPPYPQFIETGFSVSFGAINTSSSFRLVALPGDLSQRIEAFTNGEANGDWVAYIQDSTTQSVQLYSPPSDFRLQPGNGIWFLSKKNWEIAPRNVPSVPLSSSGTFSIPLQKGWNIISNPFDVDLNWEDVSSWNNLSQPLWAWDGSYKDTIEFRSSAQEGLAYYYFNAEQATSIELPYPGLVDIFSSKTSQDPEVETLTITARNEQSLVSEVTVGRAHQAKAGIDNLDLFAPPGDFSTIQLTISNSNSSTQFLPLARDIQPGQHELLRFDMTLTAPKGDPIEVQIDQLEAFEMDAITLINVLDASTYNLHEKHAFWFTPEKDITPFALFIGSASAVQEAIEKIHPLSLLLKQNYPNPVLSSTTIEFSLPDPQHATLSIYDAMGRLVKVLLDRELEAGLHHVEWLGDDQQLANGIYFYRLKTDSNTLHKKMILLR